MRLRISKGEARLYASDSLAARFERRVPSSLTQGRPRPSRTTAYLCISHSTSNGLPRPRLPSRQWQTARHDELARQCEVRFGDWAFLRDNRVRTHVACGGRRKHTNGYRREKPGAIPYARSGIQNAGRALRRNPRDVVVRSDRSCPPLRDLRQRPSMQRDEAVHRIGELIRRFDVRSNDVRGTKGCPRPYRRSNERAHGLRLGWGHRHGKTPAAVGVTADVYAALRCDFRYGMRPPPAARTIGSRRRSVKYWGYLWIPGKFEKWGIKPHFTAASPK